MSHGFTTAVSDGIAEIVIARPPVNALNDAGWHALADELTRVGQLPETHVIVLRGEGRGFCAGVDIKELDREPERIVSVNAGNYRSFEAVHRCPVPVIVAVHGFVLGGGIGLAGAADIVVASEALNKLRKLDEVESAVRDAYVTVIQAEADERMANFFEAAWEPFNKRAVLQKLSTAMLSLR